MDTPAQVLGFLLVSTACGVLFAIGVISTCRWMKWSPVMVVNYFPDAADVTVLSHPARPERAGE